MSRPGALMGLSRSSPARVPTVRDQQRHPPLHGSAQRAASCSPLDVLGAAGGLVPAPLLAPVCSPSALLADCSQPLDVALLLDGSSSFPASYFEEMKSFAKAFISRANIGERCPGWCILGVPTGSRV